MTTKLKKPNVPARLHGDDQESQGFLQTVSNYSDSLIMVGMDVKWGSTVSLSNFYLKKDGQTVAKLDYPLLWDYAQDDPAYTTTATDVTLPNEAGYWVKAK